MSVHSINVGARRLHSVVLSCVATVTFGLVLSSAGFAQDNKAQLPPNFKVPRPIAEFMKDQEGDELTSDEAIAQWQKNIRPHLSLAYQAKTLEILALGQPLRWPDQPLWFRRVLRCRHCQMLPIW